MLAFFLQPQVRRAIDDLADAPALTVVVGAGASMEVGLPSWEQLVLALLDEVIDRKGWKSDEDAFKDAARRQGLLTTAEVVEAMLTRRQMHGAIRRRLYGGTPPRDLRPGPLAKSIASLQDVFGRSMRLATTNYDELLEQALRAVPPAQRWWADVVGAVGPDAGSEHQVAVVHLHGILGVRAQGTVVLSEGDYQRMQLRRSWQEEWMVEALSGTTCLFVGASMTDSNLIRYLYGAGASERPHVALFRRRPAPTADEARFRIRAEEAERARWDRLGITPLFADNFADVTQFVHEVAYRRETGPSYVALPDRMRLWYESALGSSLYASDDEGYRTVQEILHSRVQPALDNLRDLLRNSGTEIDGEKLGVALWALRPPPPERQGEQEAAVVLAASGRIMTTIDEIVPNSLSDDSPWVGVKAICEGVPLGQPIDNYATRWRFVLAFPVYSEKPRLPLGAVTLSSMTPSPETALSRLDPSTAADLNDVLTRVAIELLTSTGS